MTTVFTVVDIKVCGMLISLDYTVSLCLLRNTLYACELCGACACVFE